VQESSAAHKNPRDVPFDFLKSVGSVGGNQGSVGGDQGSVGGDQGGVLCAFQVFRVL